VHYLITPETAATLNTGRRRPHYYLPRREVGVAGNILMSGTVHGIVPVHGICLSANSKLLQCFWNG